MKQIVVLCDGMSDLPLPKLDGKTPMELAVKPNIDYFAAHGTVGLVQTHLGDGVENDLSIFGCDPINYPVARSFLEAAANKIHLSPTDVTLCCNFVTLSEEERFEDRILLDSRAGELSSDDAKDLIHTLNRELGDSPFSFYPGDRFRGLLVWENGTTELGELTPPHASLGKQLGDFLLTHPNATPLAQLIRKAPEILSEHPINRKREEKGLPPANGIWIWSAGQAMPFPSFEEQYHQTASVLSATSYIKGIGRLSGMNVVETEENSERSGFDYPEIADAILEELEKDRDIVFVHLEGPDVYGHQGNVQKKIEEIEKIDRQIIAPVRSTLEEQQQDYKILLLPNHATPLRLQTHTADPVPFLLYSSAREYPPTVSQFTEQTAKESEIFISKGYTLLQKFLTY